MREDWKMILAIIGALAGIVIGINSFVSDQARLEESVASQKERIVVLENKLTLHESNDAKRYGALVILVQKDHGKIIGLGKDIDYIVEGIGRIEKKLERNSK